MGFPLGLALLFLGTLDSLCLNLLFAFLRVVRSGFLGIDLLSLGIVGLSWVSCPSSSWLSPIVNITFN